MGLPGKNYGAKAHFSRRVLYIWFCVVRKQLGKPVFAREERRLKAIRLDGRPCLAAK
jgi:hypothetical protein